MKKIILISILLINGLAFAQKKELGKVTIEELTEKVCPTDSSAVAAYLIKCGNVRFEFSTNNGFSIVKTYKIKIKIYKKEGYEWANQSLGYYTGSNGKDKLNFSNAITYNLVNDKIEKTKLKSDGEFEEKVNDYWSVKKITLPNVKEGSIIEYEAELESERSNSIDEWYFQSTIPVVYSEFKTAIPEYFIYNMMSRGYIAPQVLTDKGSKSISYTSKDRVSNRFGTRTDFSTDQFSYNETKTTFILQDVPALKDESYVNNIKNYTSSVKYELSSIQIPGETFKNFTTDWETVVKTIYDDDDFGAELNKTGYFEKDLDALLNGVTAQEEKIGLVFNFVKSKMNWDESYGFGCNEGVRKAYQDRKGNVAEINLMLTSMLRYAGIEANPILISTRSNGVSLFPSRTAFDYVISGVELNNQVVLFDATNKFSLPNILPIRDLNWFGRIIRKNGSSAEINLMPTSNSKEVVNIMGAINKDGSVSGKIKDQHFDYNAFVFREKNHGIAKESYIEKLEKKHQGLEIGEYDVQNADDLSKPIVENYSFTSTNAVEIIGDKMYVSPLMFFALTENPFKQETREYPVDFVYPNQDKFNISLTLPEGYVIETMPQPKAVGMPEEMGSFKYNLSNNGTQIQIVSALDINEAIISSEYYEALKSFYKEIVNKHTEKIVLKKG
ncbi:transglutaminase domain-containing protein [Flavobacterium terrisoli]|uniref:transglutaminase domain-containing protein n=1 Tax=Flavobacterium terrisoli TaxID=3242195 RepID=UPI002542A3E3|nr:DUF3857 domain-containing protein [Flavobacterium buctense]